MEYRPKIATLCRPRPEPTPEEMEEAHNRHFEKMRTWWALNRKDPNILADALRQYDDYPPDVAAVLKETVRGHLVGP